MSCGRIRIVRNIEVSPFVCVCVCVGGRACVCVRASVRARALPRERCLRDFK
jgi:hypothetical protein